MATDGDAADCLLAVIDIGTVTARLALSRVHKGRVVALTKQSTIVNLGAGVDKTGRLDSAAINRVSECIAAYVATAQEAGAEWAVCTLTSAARDAENSDELLYRLQALGLLPQVIPGEVEGRLTFLGVAQDFFAHKLLVADNGGGSTELAWGMLSAAGLDMGLVRSTNVGCRRLTDRYFSQQKRVCVEDLRAAHEFAAEQFAPVIAEAHSLHLQAEKLLACGGTATSLVAMTLELEPYDSARVHLSELDYQQVCALEEKLAGLTVEERAKLPGLQAKRAPVILAGSVAISELMKQTGCETLTVSESDLLVGMSLTLDAAIRKETTAVGWRPNFTHFD